MSSIKDRNVERYCIASLLRHPKIIADISHIITENDFHPKSKLDRTILSVILDLAKKGEEVNVFSIAQKINNVGIRFDELSGGDIIDYLDATKNIQLTEKAGIQQFKTLKTTAVAREYWEAGQRMQKTMEELHKNGASIDEIISKGDGVHGEIFNKLKSFEDNEFEDLFGQTRSWVEERADNPIDSFGPKGPFKRTFELYGSLVRPQNITLVGARTKVGKTTLSCYYNTKIADEDGCQILHIDSNEMSLHELMARQLCMLSDGVVPLDMLETGKWRRNPELKKIVESLWPKVDKLSGKYHYRSIGNMSPDEICSMIRRFYMSKVGRGNYFIINYDYFKALDSFDPRGEEWKLMGYYIQKLKDLIKNDVPEASLWTSLQLNRGGITSNKAQSQIDDTENTFSMSDRLAQIASQSFILRNQTSQELVDFPGLGNQLLIPCLTRHIGEDRDGALNKVEMADGSLRNNMIFLKNKGFCFTEIGDLNTLVKNGMVGAPHHKDDDHHRKTRNDENADF